MEELPNLVANLLQQTTEQQFLSLQTPDTPYELLYTLALTHVYAKQIQTQLESKTPTDTKIKAMIQRLDDLANKSTIATKPATDVLKRFSEQLSHCKQFSLSNATQMVDGAELQSVENTQKKTQQASEEASKQEIARRVQLKAEKTRKEAEQKAQQEEAVRLQNEEIKNAEKEVQIAKRDEQEKARIAQLVTENAKKEAETLRRADLAAKQKVLEQAQQNEMARQEQEAKDKQARQKQETEARQATELQKAAELAQKRKEEEAARQVAELAQKKQEEEARRVAELAQQKKQEEAVRQAALLAQKEQEDARKAAELAHEEQEEARKADLLAQKEQEDARKAAELAQKEQEEARKAAELAQKEQEEARKAALLAQKEQEDARKAVKLAQKNQEETQKAKDEQQEVERINVVRKPINKQAKIHKPTIAPFTPFSAFPTTDKDRQVAEEQKREEERKATELAQQKQEEETRQAALLAQKKREEERQAAELAQKKREEERKANERAQQKQEEEARQAVVLAQKKREEERKANERAQQKQEEEARQAVVLAQKKREEEARHAAELAKKKQEEETRQAALLAQKKREEERKVAELAKKKQEEETRQAALLAQKKREEERKVAELAKKKQEEETRQAAELATRQQEEARKAQEAQQAAELEKKRKKADRLEQKRREVEEAKRQKEATRLEQERLEVEKAATERAAAEKAEQVRQAEETQKGQTILKSHVSRAKCLQAFAKDWGVVTANQSQKLIDVCLSGAVSDVPPTTEVKWKELGKTDVSHPLLTAMAQKVSSMFETIMLKEQKIDLYREQKVLTVDDINSIRALFHEVADLKTNITKEQQMFQDVTKLVTRIPRPQSAKCLKTNALFVDFQRLFSQQIANREKCLNTCRKKGCTDQDVANIASQFNVAMGPLFAKQDGLSQQWVAKLSGPGVDLAETEVRIEQNIQNRLVAADLGQLQQLETEYNTLDSKRQSILVDLVEIARTADRQRLNAIMSMLPVRTESAAFCISNMWNEQYLFTPSIIAECRKDKPDIEALKRTLEVNPTMVQKKLDDINELRRTIADLEQKMSVQKSALREYDADIETIATAILKLQSEIDLETLALEFKKTAYQFLSLPIVDPNQLSKTTCQRFSDKKEESAACMDALSKCQVMAGTSNDCRYFEMVANANHPEFAIPDSQKQELLTLERQLQNMQTMMAENYKSFDQRGTTIAEQIQVVDKYRLAMIRYLNLNSEMLQLMAKFKSDEHTRHVFAAIVPVAKAWVNGNSFQLENITTLYKNTKVEDWTWETFGEFQMDDPETSLSENFEPIVAKLKQLYVPLQQTWDQFTNNNVVMRLLLEQLETTNSKKAFVELLFTLRDEVSRRTALMNAIAAQTTEFETYRQQLFAFRNCEDFQIPNTDGLVDLCRFSRNDHLKLIEIFHIIRKNATNMDVFRWFARNYVQCLKNEDALVKAMANDKVDQFNDLLRTIEPSPAVNPDDALHKEYQGLKILIHNLRATSVSLMIRVFDKKFSKNGVVTLIVKECVETNIQTTISDLLRLSLNSVSGIQVEKACLIEPLPDLGAAFRGIMKRNSFGSVSSWTTKDQPEMDQLLDMFTELAHIRQLTNPNETNLFTTVGIFKAIRQELDTFIRIPPGNKTIAKNEANEISRQVREFTQCEQDCDPAAFLTAFQAGFAQFNAAVNKNKAKLGV